MLKPCAAPWRAARGTSLVEVLVTLVITAYGVLGLAGLMNGMQMIETEGYQRSQALVLLSDMSERISAGNPQTAEAAAAYVVASAAPVGTGDSQPADCSTLAAGGAREVCEWSNALKGSAERIAGNKVGAISGARGCIELLATPDATAGTCTPATFRVSVVWQGLLDSAAPASACGRNLYGKDSSRRLLAQQVTVGLPQCTLHE